MGLSDIDEDEPVTNAPSKSIILGGPTSGSPASSSSGPVTGTHGAYATHTTTNTTTAMNRGRGNAPPQQVSGANVLDDLFSNMDVGGSPSSAQAHPSPLSASSLSPPRKPASTTTAAPSVLDDLFAAPPAAAGASPAGQRPGGAAPGGLYVDGTSGGAEDDGNNLFDLSRPVKKERYNNAETFLDAFERQGKKGGGGGGRAAAADTLGSLTRNKDDNKVRARLLALMNYYDVLGVAPTASEEEIRRNYKKRALELHPDRVGRDQTPEEAELFKRITKANEILTDTELRRTYDAELSGGQAAPTAANDWWSHMLRRSLFRLSWRDQNISYVKYLNVCTESLHMTLKDKAHAKYAKFSSPNYVAMKADGTGGMEEVKKVPSFTKDY